VFVGVGVEVNKQGFTVTVGVGVGVLVGVNVGVLVGVSVGVGVGVGLGTFKMLGHSIPFTITTIVYTP
jgi:hypothetical protein